MNAHHADQSGLASEPSRCPACLTRMDPLGDIPLRDFDGSIFTGDAKLYECPRCGFARKEIGRSDIEITEHYARSSLYSVLTGPGVGGDSPEDVVRYEALANFMDEAGCLRGSFADIGCSRGGYVKHLAGRPGLSVTGVDCDATSLAQLAEAGIETQVGEVFSLPLASGSRDTLSYLNVLEHVCDVERLLREAHRVLKPHGHLVIEVPDASNYDAPECRVGPMYWLGISEHVNHFSAPALYGLLQRNGFGVRRGASMQFPIRSVKKYASLVVVAERDGATHSEGVPTGRQSLREHLAAESAAMARLVNRLELSVSGFREVTFWGIGLEFFVLLGHASAFLRGKTVHLVDSNPAKQGRTVKGLPVGAPHDAAPHGCLVCASFLSGDVIRESAIAAGWPEDAVFELNA